MSEVTFDLTRNEWNEVINEISAVPMFRGIYDAKNGEEEFMYGVLTVIEYIANKAGNASYPEMFLKNMAKSEEKNKQGSSQGARL